MRFWKAFETAQARKEWEKEQKKARTDFVVCMHFSAKDLEKELFMPKGSLTNEGYKFCTVYGFKGQI